MQVIVKLYVEQILILSSLFEYIDNYFIRRLKFKLLL